VIQAAALREIDIRMVEQHNCGALSVECNFCKAKNFAAERPIDRKFTTCCRKSKLPLPPIRSQPLIEQLMTNKLKKSKNFKDSIKSINSALTFAFMGANLAPPPGYGPYFLRINGAIYHRSGALHPTNGDQIKIAQPYILDPDEAAALRMQLTGKKGCDPDLMQELSRLMTTVNPFADACKMLFEVGQESIADAKYSEVQPAQVSLAIIQDRKNDKRRYNAPR